MVIEDINILCFHDTYIDDAVADKVLKRIAINDGYCPCVTERNHGTRCPCSHYIQTHKCHCGLYKVLDNVTHNTNKT
jgi:hypothetical protein